MNYLSGLGDTRTAGCFTGLPTFLLKHIIKQKLIMKTCSTCKEVQEIELFNKDRTRKDGHSCRCKKCDSIKRKKYWIKVKNTPELHANSKERQAVRRKKVKADPVRYNWRLKQSRDWARKLRESENYQPADYEATKIHKIKYLENNREKINAGAMARRHIKPNPCEVCGNPNSERHHPDYSKPLEVIFLCSKHHAKLHVKLREQERLVKER